MSDHNLRTVGTVFTINCFACGGKGYIYWHITDECENCYRCRGSGKKKKMVVDHRTCEVIEDVPREEGSINYCRV